MFRTTLCPPPRKITPASGSSSSSAGVASNNNSSRPNPASIEREASCSSSTAPSSTENDSGMATLSDELIALIIDKLPHDNLGTASLQRFGITCKRFSAITRPKLLLQYVANGQQNEAEKLLSSHPDLLLNYGTVTDYAGRTFENISALQLAAWSWDMPMWIMMLNCLPKNEERERIRLALLKQCDELDTPGVEYSLEGNTYYTSHFDFAPLISAYEGYLALFDAPQPDWDAIDNHWRTVVGKAQRYLPVELRHQFCGERSFHPTPAFTEIKFKRSLEVYNWATEKFVVWDNSLSDLGRSFGIFRHQSEAPSLHDMRWSHVRPVWVSVDLAAVTAYCKERTENYAKLKELLQNPIQIAVEASSEVPQEESRCVIS